MMRRLVLVLLALCALAAPNTPLRAATPNAVYCTHVTKSTLMQSPIARPVFRPADVARLDLSEDGFARLTLGTFTVTARHRFCARTSDPDCTPPRAIAGDVVTFYRQIGTADRTPVFGIWHRKGVQPDHLIENVVLRCCTTKKDC